MQHISLVVVLTVIITSLVFLGKAVSRVQDKVQVANQENTIIQINTVLRMTALRYLMDNRIHTLADPEQQIQILQSFSDDFFNPINTPPNAVMAKPWFILTNPLRVVYRSEHKHQVYLMKFNYHDENHNQQFDQADTFGSLELIQH